MTDVDLVLEAVRSSLDRAIRTAPIPKFRPGTVRRVDADEQVAEVAIDGVDDPGVDDLIGATIIYPTGIFPGDRVMVVFIPPHGALIIGRLGGSYDPWHVVGLEDDEFIPFGTGWTHHSNSDQIGSAANAYVSFRRHGRVVELRGRAERTSGSGTLVFTLPEGYLPENDLIIPANGLLAGYTPALIGIDGEVRTASTDIDEICLDGVMFSVAPPDIPESE